MFPLKHIRFVCILWKIWNFFSPRKTTARTTIFFQNSKFWKEKRIFEKCHCIKQILRQFLSSLRNKNYDRAILPYRAIGLGLTSQGQSALMSSHSEIFQFRFSAVH